MALVKAAQTDFSAGMFRTATGDIPDRGFYDSTNMLTAADGSLFRRPGTTYLSTANFGSKLTWMWNGRLENQNPDTTVVMNGANMGVMNNTTGAIVNTGAPMTTIPGRGVVINGVLYIPTGNSATGIAYGGSAQAAYTYTTGTVAVTNGLTNVTGTGTSWSGIDSYGALIRIGGTGSWYSLHVNSNTSLGMVVPWQGATGSGLTYELRNYAPANFYSGSHFATIGNRLVMSVGHQVYFSAVNDPGTVGAFDYHELDETVKGLQRLRDDMLVFTDSGMWSISNLALDLTDAYGNPQQSLTKINGNLVLWDDNGIAEYEGTIIVPGVDDIWMIDSVSAPRSIGWQITSLIKSYSQSYRLGVATVYAGHYFLPVIDYAGNSVDMLVCRLDRPVGTPRGTAFPWTRWNGIGAQFSAVATQAQAIGSPRLLGAGATTTSRVFLSGDAGLQESPTNTTDADGSSIVWTLQTRDYPTDGLAKSLLKKLRLRYVSSGSVSAQCTTDYSVSGVSLPATQGGGADATGTASHVYSTGSGVSKPSGRHMRFFLFGVARTTIRAVEAFVRPKGRQ
jgi:hypothetical protein